MSLSGGTSKVAYDTRGLVAAAFERIRSRCIDRDFLAQELLDVVARDRLSAFPWRGQFTPGLVGLLLDSYSRDGATVLDPFVGSGTTLAEATKRGMEAIGAEVNPAAIELARIYTLCGRPVAIREEALNEATERLTNCLLNDQATLFGDAPDDIREEIIRIYDNCSSPEAANLIAVTMMLAMGDTDSMDSVRLGRAFKQVAEVVNSMPPATTPCSVYAADARNLPVSNSSIDLVVTSPPYINVFNYHQNYRPATERLGWHVLSAAKSEIGSNRKHRQNRFLTVVQYAMDMMMALQEFQRVTRVGANVIIVIGRESRVRGVSFANGEIVGCLAELISGIEFVRWQERSFLNRFGEKIYEEVLTFRSIPGDNGANILAQAAEVGRQVLVTGRLRAGSEEILTEIDDAIAQSQDIKPSPEFALLRKGKP